MKYLSEHSRISEDIKVCEIKKVYLQFLLQHFFCNRQRLGVEEVRVRHVMGWGHLGIK